MPIQTTAIIDADFEPEKLKEDTFSISANYRDPFLGKIKKEVKIIGPPKPTKPAPKPIVKPEAPLANYTF